MNEPGSFASYMQQGAALHAGGQPEQALVVFEQALALDPGNANAASACATMLAGLGQPQAAYQVLHAAQAQLLMTPDGATNLAIAAETCGKMDFASAAYARALQLDPDHLRALNNSALILGRAGDWDGALRMLKRCTELAPNDSSTWCNLADTLIASRRFAGAAGMLAELVQRFPHNAALAARRVLALAFDGQIESAQAGLDKLDAEATDLLKELTAGANMAQSRHIRQSAPRVPDAYDLFCRQAFDAMQECDWRDHDRLTAVLREMLARCARTGQVRDWRDAQFYGLMLPLREDEMFQLRRISMDAIAGQLSGKMAPFVARRSKGRDGRIHVGLATQNMRDPRFVNALDQQLLAHDRSRFALHVYSPTPNPDFADAERLGSLGIAVVEIAHMSNDEAVARIRLDELDVFVDAAFNTPWCRPEIPERRVAPIQIRQTTWHRHHPPRQCDYNMSDTFVHPDGIDVEPYGVVVRLPHTCWLATNNDAADPLACSRADAGLPDQALVLCCFVPPVMVDPQSFGLWMKMLKALPEAVLWLPAYAAATRTNLARAAQASGVDATRLVYLPSGSRAQLLARIQLADLFVDTVRFNANHGLADALRMGVPAVTCAGQGMASRLGGSIVRAAGLGDCVVESPAAFVETVVRLGTDASALGGLRARLEQRHAAAPLFDLKARVGEWEAAWTMMVQRHQAGLPPQAFDVPAQAPAPAAGPISR